LAAAVETAISIQWEDIVTQFVTGPLGILALQQQVKFIIY
jgi:hypothetical protein